MSSEILTISEKDRTPLVDALLRKLEERDQRIDELMEAVQLLKEENQALKDEIAKLKKTSGRPKFPKKTKNSKKQSGQAKKRPGSEKKSKKGSLRVDEVKCVAPANLPPGAKLKRQRSFIVQELVMQSRNTKYILEEFVGPDGQSYSAQVPSGVAQVHFGLGLVKFILYQYHHCQVTQPLLREMLTEIGIDISAGKINEILTENLSEFHREKDEILRKGLEISAWVQTDDTGARHQGKTGYCTHIGNDLFAWFGSTDSKSRINFLKILGSPFGGGYELTPTALKYMKQEKLPQIPLSKLDGSIRRRFDDEESWLGWLNELGIIKKRHIRIATQGALLGGAIECGLNPELIILSDDAGQFNVPLMMHALCWVHAIRHIKKLVPATDKARIARDQALSDAYGLYELLKQFRDCPTASKSQEIEIEFDALFERKTAYATLNLLLKRIYRNRSELLLVLAHSEVPLHDNASEGDIREFVKRRKVSGGTRSSSGRHARDTFASLKKTCRKLAVSFWDLLGDRLAVTNLIPPLPELMSQKAAEYRQTTSTSRGIVSG